MCALIDEKGRNISGVLIAQLEVRHRGRARVGLRILDPGINPFPAGFFCNVNERRRIIGRFKHIAIRLGYGVAMEASHGGEQATSFVEAGCARKIAQVALSTRRIQVPRGKQRLLPCFGRVVCLLNAGCGPLSAMTHDATELVQVVRDRWMLPERLDGSPHERTVLVDMTALTAIDHTKLGNPSLANACMKIADQVAALPLAGQFDVRLLVMAPVAEIVLSGCDRKRNQQSQAYDAESREFARRRATAERCEFISIVHSVLHGTIHDHPGPRKNVPIAVSMINSTMNQVMIQKESGRSASHRCSGFADADVNREDHNNAPPTRSVGMTGMVRSSRRSNQGTAPCLSWGTAKSKKIKTVKIGTTAIIQGR